MTDYDYERDIRPVETMDWNAATHSVPLAEIEEREIEINEIVGTWQKQTEEGREFAVKYNTESNRKALLSALEIVGEVSWPALSDTFSRLRNNNKLVPYQAPPSKAEVEQSNKARWEADCLAWYQAPNRSTKDIKSRLESDKAFASWFRNKRFEVAVEDGTALQKQAHVLSAPESAAGFHPDNLQWHRRSLREQAKQDEAYKQVPTELRAFAADYHRMTARQVKTQMANPDFRRKMEEAAKHGLI